MNTIKQDEIEWNRVNEIGWNRLEIEWTMMDQNGTGRNGIGKHEEA